MYTSKDLMLSGIGIMWIPSQLCEVNFWGKLLQKQGLCAVEPNYTAYKMIYAHYIFCRFYTIIQ